MCLGMNPDILAPRQRCASTSNRNFEGRQGRDGRTHLVSPATGRGRRGGRPLRRRARLGVRGVNDGTHSSTSRVVAPLHRENIDTDQIIPKQHLKRIERTGFGDFLFFDWRYHPDGRDREDFVLNRRTIAMRTILVAGKNFGCGSSREHAAWALGDFGFRVILAPSFADIFRNNAGNNGLLVIELPEEVIQSIAEHAESHAPYHLNVDLEQQTITDDSGLSEKFEVDPFRRHRLLHGLDEIGMTLAHEADIAHYEAQQQPSKQ